MSLVSYGVSSAEHYEVDSITNLPLGLSVTEHGCTVVILLSLRAITGDSYIKTLMTETILISETLIYLNCQMQLLVQEEFNESV